MLSSCNGSSNFRIARLLRIARYGRFEPCDVQHERDNVATGTREAATPTLSVGCTNRNRHHDVRELELSTIAIYGVGNSPQNTLITVSVKSGDDYDYTIASSLKDHRPPGEME
jgi:hypothetical protein